MGDLLIGQPEGGVYQVAYIVPNLKKGMEEFTAHLGIGPWFVLDYHATPRARYRGKPTDVHCLIATCFSGHLHIELFEMMNDSPSIYREVVERQGYGFHHWARSTKDFDGDVERYRKLGYELAFFEHHTRGRVGYFDTTGRVPGFVEICEFSEHQEKRMFNMYEAARNWDGTNPVREASH